VSNTVAVVVTSIAAPNAVLRQIASDCAARDLHFYVIGDHKSPPDFDLAGCDFYSLERQQALSFETVRHSLNGSYARKNIGYLLAMQQGCTAMIETDDDNLPCPDFYEPLPQLQTVPVARDAGWVNVYRYFSDVLLMWCTRRFQSCHLRWKLRAPSSRALPTKIPTWMRCTVC
jgi:hypothetical protein